MTLRKALAYLDASIAVGLLVENWSAYPLSKPTIEINEGKVVQENTTIPVPGSVKAGTMNAGIVLQSKVKYSLHVDIVKVDLLDFQKISSAIFQEILKNPFKRLLQWVQNLIFFFILKYLNKYGC